MGLVTAISRRTTLPGREQAEMAAERHLRECAANATGDTIEVAGLSDPKDPPESGGG
jgi:hypothetical protein